MGKYQPDAIVLRFAALHAGAAVQGNQGLALRRLQQGLVQMGAVDAQIGQAVPR